MQNTVEEVQEPGSSDQANQKEAVSQPLVSVFMSVYNGGDYLAEAVESVLNQTYQHYEFIIVNDGSKDGTADYLDGLSDERVKVIHQENQGLGKPLNKWMQTCAGKYVMRLDADDICHETRMEKQVAFLETHPEVILVGSQIQMFSEKGRGAVSSLFTDHESILGGMLKGWHTQSHPTIMWRRTLLDHIPGYAFSGAGEDWSFLLDAARFGKLANHSEVLYYYRLHASSNAWKGAKRVQAGLTYAIRRYERFMKTGEEYPLDDFMNEWSRRSLFKVMNTELQAMSAVQYRKAMLAKMEGKKLPYYSRLGVAALLDPAKTIGAIRKKLNVRVRSAK